MLVAAFDHRHIFIDPDARAACAFEERKRLFDLPRSSWADYDVKLISKGGGVFPRTAKEIALSGRCSGSPALPRSARHRRKSLRALLTAQIDLLFFGGIGTFIKATRSRMPMPATAPMTRCA